MSNAELEKDEYLDDEEDLGPSLAIPPIYVLRTGTGCPACRKAVAVYALGSTAFRDAEEGHLSKQFHILTFVTSLPEELTALLGHKCPSYFLDQEEGSDTAYFMNHCGCGATIDDDFLHGDVGAAFWLRHRSEYQHMTLFRLSITEPIPVTCSYAIGGDEYLGIAQVQAW